MRDEEVERRRVEPGPGPVFISGRQHSGNTLMTAILARIPDCLAQLDENSFFEHRQRLDRVDDRAGRVGQVVRLLRLEDATALAETPNHLEGWSAEHPEASSLEIYREGMRHATAVTGHRWWAQKATSYIFYADEILAAMPDARILYMLRNPFDLAASAKQRKPEAERLFRTMWSWRRGLRIAERLEAESPDRVRIVHYEELSAGRGADQVFEFLGVPLDAAYLDVAHVNRAETGYSLDGPAGVGLTSPRVYRYPAILDPVEIAALDKLADTDQLHRWYPDLPHLATPASRSTRRRGAIKALSSPLKYAANYAGRLGEETRQIGSRRYLTGARHLVTRALRRIRRP